MQNEQSIPHRTITQPRRQLSLGRDPGRPPELLTSRSMPSNEWSLHRPLYIAVSLLLMAPSIRARFAEVFSSLDLPIVRELPTTKNPRSSSARVLPQPMTRL
jgi:hypothetical protein